MSRTTDLRDEPMDLYEEIKSLGYAENESASPGVKAWDEELKTKYRSLIDRATNAALEEAAKVVTNMPDDYHEIDGEDVFYPPTQKEIAQAIRALKKEI